MGLCDIWFEMFSFSNFVYKTQLSKKRIFLRGFLSTCLILGIIQKPYVRNPIVRGSFVWGLFVLARIYMKLFNPAAQF